MHVKELEIVRINLDTSTKTRVIVCEVWDVKFHNYFLMLFCVTTHLPTRELVLLLTGYVMQHGPIFLIIVKCIIDEVKLANRMSIYFYAQ